MDPNKRTRSSIGTPWSGADGRLAVEVGGGVDVGALVAPRNDSKGVAVGAVVAPGSVGAAVGGVVGAVVAGVVGGAATTNVAQAAGTLLPWSTELSMLWLTPPAWRLW